MKKIKIAVCLGDKRQEYLAKMFQKEFFVSTFSEENDLLGEFDIYVLPTPISRDGVYINTKEKIEIKNFLEKIPKNSIIFAGSISKIVEDLFFKHKLIDFLKYEQLAILNAIPTAEGALQIALEQMPITLSKSEALVIGNGRIGKILASKLQLLGANTTVSARKKEDFADILSNNMQFTYLANAEIEKFDVIFNTVPSLVLDEKILDRVGSETVIIDLASNPSGTDFDYAKKIGLNAISALSLPAKVAPKTAGAYIFDTIIDILEEMEVNL